ncbi:MAG TPA: DUF6263 family protein [Fulvivirga sp.]|nr:DUF6263 family protein [Fulvivirga sp.]
MKIISTLAVLLTFTFCQAQKSELILRLEKDVEYIQSTNSESTIIQEINGQKMNIVMTINGTMSYLVKAINDDSFDMDVAYKSLSMSMQLPQGKMEFSSEKKDEGDIFSLILSEMKNKEFQVKMTKYGKITEIRNIEKLFESAFSILPEIPEAQLSQIKTQLLKAYGKEAYKGNIEMITAIYPNKKVAKGDEWVINTKLESGMSANMTTTYKFLDSTKEHYLIVGESKIETADKDAYIESNGMPMKFDLTGFMTSNIKIDKTSGWIVVAKIDQDIQGDTYIKENPQMPNGMKIPMIMKSKMVFTNN